MDELAMGSTNKTALTGPVYNPWNTSRITGGSSGGSAAVVFLVGQVIKKSQANPGKTNKILLQLLKKRI